ncbi:hypothetical protein [Aegicerativicinus sediminis]
MNKLIKTILFALGIGLLIYGIYTLIAPEASLKIGNFGIEAQDNTNSYITIGLGILALGIAAIGGKGK